ncbi:MAG: hypothetical protein QOD74_3099 [Variibacter sp.]|jgi:hypothetical protein|nr:hypothetical protein [Variibacter sp.]
MASVDECLREASHCVKHAEESAEKSEQAVFMLMAKSWMQLAVQIDEVHPSPSVATDGEDHADQPTEDAGLETSASPETAPASEEAASSAEASGRKAKRH